MLKQSHFVIEHGNLSITVKVDEHIINTIITKLHHIQSRGYISNYLILWTGYSKGIQEITAHYDMMSKYYEATLPVKIMGLNLIWTDIPDTIEVY